jgi:hypothetical protein
LEEMVVRIAGERMYPWRAVDHEGEVLDVLVQRRRDTRAALRLMRKLAQEARLCTEIAGHRQAALVRHSIPASTAELPARPGAPGEQSDREFASGSAATRAQNAAVQIGSIRPVLSQHACRRP